MESQIAKTGVGDPIALVSSGNHDPADWAAATSQIILDARALAFSSPVRHMLAIVLQQQVANLLASHYKTVIDREIAHLGMYADHCDSDYDVLNIAEKALEEIKAVAFGTLWESLLGCAEWQRAATECIAQHLSTAIHVERLLFADRHPDNPSAVAYRARFQGQQ